MRTLLGRIELLRAGVTRTVGFLFDPPDFTEESLEPVIRAYRDLGMRVILAMSTNDRPYRNMVLVERGRFRDDLLDIRARSPVLEEARQVAPKFVARGGEAHALADQLFTTVVEAWREARSRHEGPARCLPASRLVREC